MTQALVAGSSAVQPDYNYCTFGASTSTKRPQWLPVKASSSSNNPTVACGAPQRGQRTCCPVRGLRKTRLGAAFSGPPQHTTILPAEPTRKLLNRAQNL